MTRARRAIAQLCAALAGAALGAGIVVATAGVLQGDERPSAPPRAAPAEVAPFEPQRSDAKLPSLLLAWAPGGIPATAEVRLERVPGVRYATTVAASLEWLRSWRPPSASAYRHMRGDGAVPIEVAYVEPREYAEFVPPGEREMVFSLRRGDALLPETSARLRGSAAGTRLRFTDHRVAVTGVISDFSANGYEVVQPASALRSAPRDRYVIMRVSPAADRTRIERVVARLVNGRPFRVRAEGETPFLRYGDAVLPQMYIKEAFGEFSAVSHADGTITIDRKWVENSIVRTRVPVLGTVVCHRALIPQMRAALAEVVRHNLGFLLDRADYGGCYSPRFVNRNPQGRLSHHSWGIAFDVNVSENPFGSQPRLDRRIVEIFEDHGLTWGGRWLLPDGMHFEWVEFP